MPWLLPVASPVLDAVLVALASAVDGARPITLKYNSVVNWAMNVIDEEVIRAQRKCHRVCIHPNVCTPCIPFEVVVFNGF